MPIGRHPGTILRDRIEEYRSRRGGFGQLNGDQCLQIMRLVRKVIERDKPTPAPMYARLYADWLMHNELNNQFVLSIVEQINAAFAKGQLMAWVVPELLGLGHLRQELVRIFDKYSVSDEILQTGSLWLRFGGLLLEEVAENPIGFSECRTEIKGKARQALQRITDQSIEVFGNPGKGEPAWFDRLVIEEHVDDEGHFAWRLEFCFPDGERFGIRGILIFADSHPFRVDDISRHPNPTRSDYKNAADRLLLANRTLGGLFPIRPPKDHLLK
ncbi:hypothetical protein AAFN88_17745 [Pelagibius sp. CAU 1746]|uniref:hypothetical protein n=1 Tax=Pelagibius sp. CAU 1746 TaxID=3140370 RepID=UPI00325AE720